jgi:hypothetical protein
MKKTLFITLIVSLLFYSCNNGESTVQISLENTLDFNRSEIVSVPIEKISSQGIDLNKNILVVNDKGTNIPFQLTERELLINAEIAAKNTIELLVKNTNDTISFDFETSAFSRFVPERIDDYTWENNKVAFRTYGPEAQRLKENNQKGGTLSSGIDCWLKRVEYPIIDKWYKNFVEGKTYHKDYGEGLDNYHVGTTRGCGGIGIFKEDSLYTSKNFTKWKTIQNGPLRTQFELEYTNWGPNNLIRNERKLITLDHNSNLMKVEVILDSETTIDNLTLGIAIHDNSLAETIENGSQGWYGIWTEHFDSQLGTAVLLDPKQVIGFKDYRIDVKDRSHLFVTAKPEGNKIMYYTGFGWVKSKQFDNMKDWETYLNTFAKRLNNPIVLKHK